MEKEVTSVVISMSVADVGCELSAFGALDDPVELDDGGGGLSCCFFFENMPPRPFTIRAEGVVGMLSLRDEVFDGWEVFERVFCDGCGGLAGRFAVRAEYSCPC